MSQWEFFTLDEMRCKCGCGQVQADHQFMTKLDWLRGEVGFPLRVTSGYRCPDHNEAVSSTGRDGPHTTGMAVDLGVAGDHAVILLKQAIKMNFRGIGIHQRGPWPGRFIHLDTLDRVAVWSY